MERSKAERDAEQAAFDSWAETTVPSGDVDQVHSQWLSSLEYASFLDEAASPRPDGCECHACIQQFDLRAHPGSPWPLSASKMILCPSCGNKRCPKANNHRNECTGSNDPGQPGSAYPAVPWQAEYRHGMAAEMLGTFQAPQHDPDLWEMAREYYRRTETYDRTVCTGPIGADGIQPVDHQQLATINRHAAVVLGELMRRAGPERAQALRKAMHAYVCSAQSREDARALPHPAPRN